MPYVIVFHFKYKDIRTEVYFEAIIYAKLPLKNFQFP